MRGERAKAIAAGKYLATMVDHTVQVTVNGRTGKATLRVVEARAREKRYWFEIIWDDNNSNETRPSKPAPKPSKNVPKKAKLEPAVTPTSNPPAGGNDEKWE
jgi:hypothetical protein